MAAKAAGNVTAMKRALFEVDETQAFWAFPTATVYRTGAPRWRLAAAARLDECWNCLRCFFPHSTNSPSPAILPPSASLQKTTSTSITTRTMSC